MALSVKSVTFSAATSTGNQSVTGVGFQPKAIIFLWGGLTSAGVGAPGTDDSYGRGFTDGTNDAHHSMSAKDGSSVRGDYIGNNGCISFVNTSGSIQSKATLSSFDADGFTINWDTNAGTAWLVTAICIGGTDITDVTVGDAIVGTSDSTETIGFDFDGLLTSASISSSLNVAAHESAGIGVCHGTGATESHFMGVRHRAGNNTSYSGYDQGSAAGEADDSATPNALISVSAKDASGFTFQRDTGTSDCAVIYLAIKGATFEQGIIQSPTSTGTQNISMSNTPVGMFMDTGGDTAADTFDNPGRSSIGWMSGAADEACVSLSQDGISDHYAAHKTDKVICLVEAATNTVVEEAEFSAFSTNQATVDWTVIDASQFRYGWFAIAEIAGGGATATLDVTEGDDSLSASATVLSDATADVTEGDDTLSASGNVGSAPTATLDVTEGDDTSTISGTVDSPATLNVTEQDDSITAQGGIFADGTLNVTDADDTITASATLLTPSTLAANEDDDTLSASVSILSDSTLNKSEEPDTIVAQGSVGNVSATLNVTEDDDTLVANDDVFSGNIARNPDNTIRRLMAFEETNIDRDYGT